MNDGDRLKALLETAQPAQPGPRKRGGPPQPGIEIGADGTGEATVVVTNPADGDEKLAELGRGYGLPVEKLELTRVIAYGSAANPMYSLKYRVRRITELEPAFADLMARARKRRPRKKVEHLGDATLVVGTLTDAQAGKGNPDKLLETWDDAVGHIEDRVRDLRRLGRGVSTIYATGLGDTTEGCGGNPNYPDQDRTVTLNESQQIEVATDMLERALDRWSGKVSRVVTSTVSSNHDAKRVGKDYPMGREDCRAFTIWRAVARAFRQNPDRYGHVEFWIPEDPDTAVIDLHGIGIASIHGDLATRSPNGVADKMWLWWAGQRMGGLPAGDCSVLNVAHFHHYYEKSQQGLRLFGHPAMDIGGSQHFTKGTGKWSYPGILSYVVDANGVRDVHMQEFR